MHFAAANLKARTIEHEIMALQSEAVRFAVWRRRCDETARTMAARGKDATIQREGGEQGEMNELAAFHL